MSAFFSDFSSMPPRIKNIWAAKEWEQLIVTKASRNEIELCHEHTWRGAYLSPYITLGGKSRFLSKPTKFSLISYADCREQIVDRKSISLQFLPKLNWARKVPRVRMHAMIGLQWPSLGLYWLKVNSGERGAPRGPSPSCFWTNTIL